MCLKRKGGEGRNPFIEGRRVLSPSSELGQIGPTSRLPSRRRIRARGRPTAEEKGKEMYCLLLHRMNIHSFRYANNFVKRIGGRGEVQRPQERKKGIFFRATDPPLGKGETGNPSYGRGRCQAVLTGGGKGKVSLLREKKGA